MVGVVLWVFLGVMVLVLYSAVEILGGNGGAGFVGKSGGGLVGVSGSGAVDQSGVTGGVGGKGDAGRPRSSTPIQVNFIVDGALAGVAGGGTFGSTGASGFTWHWRIR